MDDERITNLPQHVTRQILTQQVDLQAELVVLLEEGQRRITIGLGHEVDIPLLPAELEASDVSMVADRDLVICAVRAEPGGYSVERGWSNFGLYTLTRRSRVWESVPFMGETRGLQPGDKVGLGSTPAEAIQFTLPDSALVSQPKHRSRRHEQLRRQREARRAKASPEQADRRTPWPPTPRHATPAPAGRHTHDGPSATPARRVHGSRRYQRLFEVALRHWNYDMLTFGGDPTSVIALDDPALKHLKAAIGRHPAQPGRGYDLFVRRPEPDVWVAPAGQDPESLAPGAILRLKGPGNLLGFGDYMVELPEPTVPHPRFPATRPPNRTDVAEVLGLSLADLADPAKARSAYRDLIRRFHPDRHDGNPGHLSRFHEVQACWEALERGVS